MKDDTTIFPLMQKLLDCVVDELKVRDLPTAVPSIEFGHEVPLDSFCDECDGQLWVRLDTGYPTAIFPQPLEEPDRFPNSQLAYALEVGIGRPYEQVAEGLTSEENLEQARLQLADMTAMRIAICKCLSSTSFLLGEYTSLRGGGIVDGRWTVQVLWEKP